MESAFCDDYKNDIYSSRFYNTTAIPLVEFLVKLENWKLITCIEINFFKALKALTELFCIGIKEELHQIKALHSGKKLW